MKKNLNKFIIITIILKTQMITGCQPDPILTLSPASRVIVKEKSWQQNHSEIIVDADKHKNLYQIKVLGQKSNECSMHALRNLFFLTSMLEQQSKNFKTEYQRMIDEELFERTPFVNQCERDAQGTRRYPEVKEYLKTAKDFAHYLPERSDKYIDEIIEFEHYEDSSYINQLRLQALPELRLLRAGTLVLMRTLLTI